MKYNIRNMATGEWVCYGDTKDELETDDLEIANDLVSELQDYAITAEVVEVDE